ncbi:MAG: uracil-DNA glycosylase [Pyrinomonadaceae bacterium]
MTSEISELLADLKEQILYLQELGVENFAVELPEIRNSEFKIQNPKSETMQQKLERFVPAAPLKSTAQSAETEITDGKNAMGRRSSLLEQSKLSRLPSLPKRPVYSQNQISEQTRGEEMAKKKPVDENPLSESLFGDISQTLPESNETLEDIRADIGNCTRCPLWEGRTKIVHSEGNINADLVFVGEAPGANEDASGRPFVGRAGQLLDKIIEAIGLKREDVFIGNINRCRPPQNRTPTLPEAQTCKPFLLREIGVVRPKIIIVLGNTACQNLLETKVGISKIRGEFQDYFGVKVMPTFHPAYLLRDPSKKREVWEDMKKVRDELNKSK